MPMHQTPCPQCGQLKSARAEICLACRNNSYGTIPEWQECTKCHTVCPITEFHRQGRKTKRPVKKCNSCRNEERRVQLSKLPKEERRKESARRLKNYQTKNPEAYQERLWRQQIRKWSLGAQLNEIIALLRTQKHCSICGIIPKKLCIDHCHSTGKFRGLLCTGCNTGLGCFKDNPSALKTAAVYLNRD